MSEREPDRHNDDLLHRIADKVEEIHYTLHGNGEPGLKTRVALLEEAAGNRKWFMRVLVGAIIASTAANFVAVSKLVARSDAAVQRER